jgi:hypothetical protein
MTNGWSRGVYIENTSFLGAGYQPVTLGGKNMKRVKRKRGGKGEGKKDPRENLSFKVK